MTSLDYGSRRSSSNAAAKGLKHVDALKNLEFLPRRASLGVGQPPATVQKPSPPMGAKGASRRAGWGAEGGMPANVLTELNSVLNKSGRSAASNHWQQVRSGCYVRWAVQAEPEGWRVRCKPLDEERRHEVKQSRSRGRAGRRATSRFISCQLKRADCRKGNRQNIFQISCEKRWSWKVGRLCKAEGGAWSLYKCPFDSWAQLLPMEENCGRAKRRFRVRSMQSYLLVFMGVLSIFQGFWKISCCDADVLPLLHRMLNKWYMTI